MDEDTLRLPTDVLPDDCVLRLYSMRMCPYAQRARLVLSAKGIKYDRINIDLNNKPDWFFEVNPNGEVPVIIHNGYNIYQSLICSEYLEEAFSCKQLYSSEPHIRAWHKIYYNHWNTKGCPAFYSLLKSGCLDPIQSKRLTDQLVVMESFLQKAGGTYYSGDQIGFPDYMIWPWFERMPMLKDITGFEMSKDQFPLLLAWTDRMLHDRAVRECKIDSKLITEYYSKYRTGKPDFTIGAKKTKIDTVIEDPLENLDDLRDPSTRFRKTE